MWGFQRGFSLGAASRLSAEYTDFPEAAGGTNLAVDPGFAGPGDLRLRPGSPLIDAGRPGPLANAEAQEDALGYVRAADGNGDGVLRRDIGAYELQPAPPPAPAGNVLTNPGAEAGMPATDDRSSPRTAGLDAARRVHVRALRHRRGRVPVPDPARVGDALAAGDAFFAAGPGRDGRATQSADVSRRGAGDRPRARDRDAVGAARRLPRAARTARSSTRCSAGRRARASAASRSAR